VATLALLDESEPEVQKFFLQAVTWCMRIGVLSDTHSRYRTVETALEILHQRGIRLVLHCGDIEDAQTVALFEPFDSHFVFGNCDWDKAELARAIDEIGGTLHDRFGLLEAGDITIAWTHGDDKRLFRQLESEEHDFLFYGHSHAAEQHRSGSTLVVNPGALHRAKPKTFVILDTDTRKIESIVVDS
jgi:putative phosphoesterase